MSQSPLPRPPADRALTQELIYGTLRVLPRLEALVGFLLNHPVKPGDRDLEALILVGLYQLAVLGTPEHAAVAATVEATRLLGKPDKAALVNALLRRFLRSRRSSACRAPAGCSPNGCSGPCGATGPSTGRESSRPATSARP